MTPTPFATSCRRSLSIALVTCVLTVCSQASSADADPGALKKISVNDIEDLTLDSLSDALYFKANGQIYYYDPPKANRPTPMADLIELIARSQNLLIEEKKPRETVRSPEGFPAVSLMRLYLQFGKAANLAD